MKYVWSIGFGKGAVWLNTCTICGLVIKFAGDMVIFPCHRLPAFNSEFWSIFRSRRPAVSWVFAQKTFFLTNQPFGLGAIWPSPCTLFARHSEEAAISVCQRNAFLCAPRLVLCWVCPLKQINCASLHLCISLPLCMGESDILLKETLSFMNIRPRDLLSHEPILWIRRRQPFGLGALSFYGHKLPQSLWISVVDIIVAALKLQVSGVAICPLSVWYTLLHASAFASSHASASCPAVCLRGCVCGCVSNRYRFSSTSKNQIISRSSFLFYKPLEVSGSYIMSPWWCLHQHSLE